MHYVGVDQSLRSTGVVVLDADGSLLHSWAIRPTGLRGAERLLYIRRSIEPHLSPEHRAAMEAYSYGSTGKLFELGELGGVIKMTMLERGVPCVTVAPAALKKFLTGDSQASKGKIGVILKERFNLCFNSDDEADAFGLARIARALHLNEALTRAEAEVLKTLRAAANRRDPGLTSSVSRNRFPEV